MDQGVIYKHYIGVPKSVAFENSVQSAHFDRIFGKINGLDKKGRKKCIVSE